MESDLRYINHQKQMNSSLTRYQSAPTTYFSGFTEENLNNPETDGILARLLSNTNNNHATDANILHSIKQESAVRDTRKEFENQNKYMDSIHEQQSNYSPVSHNRYQGQLRPPLPDKNSGYRDMNSIGTVDRFSPLKVGTGAANSSLIRHSSSPAGLFADISMENGYNRMQPTPSNMADSAGFTDNGSSYITGFPIGSWDDSASVLDEDVAFSGVGVSENQNVEDRSSFLLSHHLSLPKSSLEKLLQHQDSVPCKIRAKRGCATHPRSIAERVRRTKISERMRKLQDLVPNMDKQTNTADMLDLAVDYIKDLQSKAKVLMENQAKCSCSHKVKH